jgi:flagellar basal-body rod modification protein FlgD
MATTDTTGLSASLPSNMLTTAQYNAQKALTPQKTSMGQSEFLTLFTTQLKNQDPTDPVKNEAFVAQLAQFSQLEATTAMKTSMDSMVSTMGSDRLLGAASLIGKSVSVPDGPVAVTNTSVSQGTINLPTGADGLQLQVFDSQGILKRTQNLGAQPPGDMKLAWDGNDDAGNPVPTGTYRYVATAISGGKTITPTVNTFATIQSVTSAGTADGAMLLDVGGGKTVNLADVKHVGS